MSKGMAKQLLDDIRIDVAKLERLARMQFALMMLKVAMQVQREEEAA